MILYIQALGISVSVLATVLILWSLAVPTKRIWPSNEPSRRTTALVWAMTFALAVSIIGLALLGWGQADLPLWLRIGVGLPLLAAGNIVVWREAGRFGAKQTMGGAGVLLTDGFYRYSRHPQYVADIALCVGWFLVSASLAALPVIIGAIIVLILAPFAEERWLEDVYGNAYRDYRQQVRRFL
ncbi:isoprenylcysteine carboxylmethyltransferase family protein [Pararhodobacter sp.]|uniref:methyltransferase family protein n=1 Tax=Pararhodobacter sp. TaxID=2127056 RepID=UPI002AFEF8C6|nr:isoprenylcysteine carboxylmethyltransferase family protein [Pararhodobacter sp.]